MSLHKQPGVQRQGERKEGQTLGRERCNNKDQQTTGGGKKERKKTQAEQENELGILTEPLTL